MAEGKRYYWLKLPKDFFKRHHILCIESLPNGKEYAYFYLKLLAESISHEGTLRFSDTIPYNEQMLATITNTNIDTVRNAMEVFKGLGLVELFDDETIYMTECEKMIGSSQQDETQRENTRLRVQKYRNKQKLLTERYCNVTCNGEIEIDIEKEIDKEKDKKESRFAPPSLEGVESYCRERNNNVDAQSFIDFYESKGWYIGKNKMKDWKAAVRTWEKREQPKQESTISMIQRMIDEEAKKNG